MARPPLAGAPHSGHESCRLAPDAAGLERELADDTALAVAADDHLSLEQLYQRAKDEAELLEFKNYELMFKIQELESNQIKMLGGASGPPGADQSAPAGRKPQLADDANHEGPPHSLANNNNKQPGRVSFVRVRRLSRARSNPIKVN